MRRAWSAGVLGAAMAAGACGSDVNLGGSPDAGADGGAVADSGATDAGSVLDAPPDAPDVPDLTPFPDGTWTMAIALTSGEWLCTGSLAGRESEVMGVTRADVGLVDGDIVLRGVDATHLEVSGPPIETGYGAAELLLEAGGGPGVPADVWIGATGAVGDGPIAGTTLIALALEAFEATLTPTGFDGRASALYADLATEGDCTVGFAVTYTR